MELPATTSLPDHRLSIEAPSHDGSAGALAGVDYSGQGLSEQQMVSRLDAYVTAHNGTLLGVQFDPADVSAGFFIVQDKTTLVATRYDFRINTHLNTVSVVGPQPWQV